MAAMLSEKLSRVMAALAAALCAILLLGMFHPHWTGVELVPGVLIFVVAWPVLYRIVLWVFVEHPAQLKKKLPMSGKELRAQRKAFYDWLSSQSTARGPRTRRRGRNDFI